MNKPLFYLVCDLHIDDRNGELIRDSIEEIFRDMIIDSVSTLVVGGDIFDYRKSQTLTTLLIWRDILDIAEYHNIQIVAIPGNHDKMDYTSESSYLDIFTHKSLVVVRDTQMLSFSNPSQLDVWMIPFFEEKETYSKYLNKVKLGKVPSILITHIAVNGVLNNDRSEVEDGMSDKKFEMFDTVFIGHYHNRQGFDNILYTGSIMQRNFGEDQFKGYTKIFEDGKYEFVDKEFQVYETVKLNYSDTITEDLEKIGKYELSEKLKVRVIINGTKEELDSLKKLEVVRVLEDGGFMLKNDYVAIGEVELDAAESFTPFTKESMYIEWDEFSELNNIETEVGKKLLKEVI